jgi:glycosyltransferase involved in cell wall biosynthesis
MPDGDSRQAREIAVFRHNLFRISEPFITQQAGQLRRYKPLYVGRLRYGDAPAGADSLALSDLGGIWPMARIGWQMLSRDPGPYQRLLAGRRPALIHAHFGIEGVYALPLAQRLGIPLITTFHGFDATLSTAALLTSPAWANYPLFRGRLARQGNLFLAASGFIRERLLAMGFPAAHTHVHYIGVDCQAIQPRDPAEETLTILHVARLVEVKGARYLIRAFARLAGQFPDVELAIVGDGPLKNALQALAKSLGVEHRVRFLGALPHTKVLAWMRKAAMLVLPSVRTSTGRAEGLGMVLLEAAATGVPAIGSRIGGIPEGIADSQTGFLVPEKDPEALAQRMADLLADPALRLGMGARARAFVLERFDIRRQTEKLEAFYDALLSPPGLPTPGAP